MTPELDLAFRLEDGEGQPLAPALQPLRAAAGVWAEDPLRAEDHWRTLLRSWLACLQPLLPPHLASPAYSLGLQLTDDATISELNGQWRQLPQPTDVLSFAAQESSDDDLPPMPRPTAPFEGDADGDAEGDTDGVSEGESSRAHPGLRDGLANPSEPQADHDPGLELGDIVISLETAARQAGDGPGALEHELLFLASHGLLHLLGWDHPDEASLTAMLTLQQQLLDSRADRSPSPWTGADGEASPQAGAADRREGRIPG